MSKKSNYITRSGYDVLEKELNFLWKEERPHVTKTVSEAAALGDRSENAEYIYGKRRLREIDRRIKFLSFRLDQLQIVTPSPQQVGKVFFGAYVTLENDVSETVNYQIVGCDEFDSKQKKISIDSPMARALLGKALDDEVRVQTPSGEQYWVVVDIAYDG